MGDQKTLLPTVDARSGERVQHVGKNAAQVHQMGHDDHDPSQGHQARAILPSYATRAASSRHLPRLDNHTQSVYQTYPSIPFLLSFTIYRILLIIITIYRI